MTLVLNGTTGVSSVDGSASTPAIQGGDANTGIFFPAADTVAIATGGTESVRVDSSQNVGIGTSSPTDRLKVVGGNVQVPRDSLLGSSATGNAIVVGTSGGSQIKFVQSGSDDELAFITHKNGASHAERARIDSSGNLLVGKTAADNSSPGVWLYNNSAQAGRINIAKNTSGLFNALTNYHSNTYVGGINYDNTSTSFPTSSDIRLKIDIVDAGSASAKIERIRVVAHGWKHDEAKVEFGVIAQELYQIAPQAVSAGDDGEEVQITWGVDYSKLVPMLIKAHQEQQALINDLTARIAALEAK